MYIKHTFFCIIVATLFHGFALSQPSLSAYPHDISYFIPEGDYKLNEKIPQPKSITGFEIGQQHLDWNNVLDYMQALSEASDRVSLKQFGHTNQFRPFIQVTITSPQNQKNLDNIRSEHLKLTDTRQSPELNTAKMPVVVNLMYNIHGN